MPSTEPKEKGIVIKPRPEPVKPKPMKGTAAYEKERKELITKKFLKPKM